MNGGLSSWTDLIDHIADRSPEEALRRYAKQYRGDSARRGELVLQLARRRNLNITEEELIRDALYPPAVDVRPGWIANAIARLVAVRRSQVRIITTNYDLLLEEALKEAIPDATVTTHALDDEENWSSKSSADAIGVLHVHGALNRTGESIGKIVLSESHYLKFGADVRAAIGRALEGSVGLFVGLSVTDPNLVGPLFELSSIQDEKNARPGDTSLYSLTVVEQVAGETDLDNALISVESVRYLDSKLNLRPILLRSYSQVEQTICELSLRIAEGGRYFDDTIPDESLVYGRRFSRALEDCYVALASPDSGYESQASHISHRLSHALTAPGGPLELLERYSDLYGTAQREESPEQFGLNLWLRTRDQPGKYAYSIDLVGSSAYVANHKWFGFRRTPIVLGTRYAAAEALYKNNYISTNLRASDNSLTWRSVVAVPLTLTGYSSEKSAGDWQIDRLTVGVITLDSTKASSLSPGQDVKERSIIGELDGSQLRDLVDRLQRTSETLFKRTLATPSL
jgi:hypothetical protein